MNHAFVTLPTPTLPFIRRIAEPRLEYTGPRTLEEMVAAHKARRKRLEAPGLRLRAMKQAETRRAKEAQEKARLDAEEAIRKAKEDARREAEERRASLPRDLDRFLAGEQIRRPSVRRIVAVAADHFKVTRLDIISHRRTKEVVLPRQIAMYLAKTMTTLSLPEIGRCIGGRDHTTIYHGVQKVTAMIGADPAFAAEVEALRAEVEERLANG